MGFGNNFRELALRQPPDMVFDHLQLVLSGFGYRAQSSDEGMRAIVAERIRLVVLPWLPRSGRVAARVDPSDDGGSILTIESGPLYAPHGVFDASFHRRAVDQILRALDQSFAPS